MLWGIRINATPTPAITSFEEGLGPKLMQRPPRAFCQPSRIPVEHRAFVRRMNRPTFILIVKFCLSMNHVEI
ncbi:MAG TPA: hypothetical protein DCS76_10640 [Gemmatimonadetes bacterium]|jgi:hypothetical protein|nr:hypothetical protein [Gemmatimonadota bacterium]